MTIHTTHPFLPEDGDRDDVRRLRGRLGTAVSLWTAGQGPDRAGLTVSSWMVAGGEPACVLGLLDPDADLSQTMIGTGQGVVQLLGWRDRDLADAFAGVAPAPGGPWRMAEWVETPHGPRLGHAETWATLRVESTQELGWSLLVTGTLEHVSVGDDTDQLIHRRGRYHRAPSH